VPKQLTELEPSTLPDMTCRLLVQLLRPHLDVVCFGASSLSTELRDPTSTSSVTASDVHSDAAPCPYEWRPDAAAALKCLADDFEVSLPWLALVAEHGRSLAAAPAPLTDKDKEGDGAGHRGNGERVNGGRVAYPCVRPTTTEMVMTCVREAVCVLDIAAFAASVSAPVADTAATAPSHDGLASTSRSTSATVTAVPRDPGSLHIDADLRKRLESVAVRLAHVRDRVK
jgi:hypothetical protein